MRSLVTVAAMALCSGVAVADETVNWSGWHAGAYGGYLFGKLASNPDHEATTANYKDDGATAGVYLGLRHQNSKALVFGADFILPLYSFKGTAVDTVYFPGLLTYEAKSKYGAFLGGHVGKAMGKALPYVFGAVGFANVDGRTLNVDLSDNYSPGFVQSAKATHFIWQGGGGFDYKASEKVFVGTRLVAFMGARADHTMSWNSPGPNRFGYNAGLVQVNVGYEF